MDYILNDHQRVNLSVLTRKILNQDRVIFSAFNDGYSNNGFINEILYLYLENSCEDFKLEPILSKVPGISIEFRLNKNTLASLNDFITSLNTKHPLHNEYPRTTTFIKTILETYARLPYIERERLIHKKILEKIQKAIENHKQLHVQTYNDNYDITPYKVESSKEGTFSYLIGFDLNENIYSIRISQISTIKVFGKATLPQNFKLVNINEKLAEFGPTFIENPIENIIIQFLTEEAQQSYEYSVIHRPIHSKIINQKERIYEFKCSLKQAEFFFFRFAGEIDILSPQKLKDWFINKYQKGIETLKNQ